MNSIYPQVKVVIPRQQPEVCVGFIVGETTSHLRVTNKPPGMEKTFDGSFHFDEWFPRQFCFSKEQQEQYEKEKAERKQVEKEMMQQMIAAERLHQETLRRMTLWLFN